MCLRQRSITLLAFVAQSRRKILRICQPLVRGGTEQRAGPRSAIKPQGLCPWGFFVSTRNLRSNAGNRVGRPASVRWYARTSQLTGHTDRENEQRFELTGEDINPLGNPISSLSRLRKNLTGRCDSLHWSPFSITAENEGRVTTGCGPVNSDRCGFPFLASFSLATFGVTPFLRGFLSFLFLGFVFLLAISLLPVRMRRY